MVVELKEPSVRGEPVSVPVAEEEQLRAAINRVGFYSVRMKEGDALRLHEDADYLGRLFRDQIAEEVEQWCELAAERLAPAVRCNITPGNDEVDAVLESASRIERPEGRLCDLGPVLVASLGDVTPAPWNTDGEYSEEELFRRIAAMWTPFPRIDARSSTSIPRRTAAAWMSRRSSTRL